ncbi:MAG TPA: family 1 glycosylhydrolase [Sphingomicrobium sp.]|jgi:beta-glucosidase/6-phospho-beta-glucosidase/beta-galactosidase|nr:family 1 glycosylhydrolase [Sphingomicrobium sp.]
MIRVVALRKAAIAGLCGAAVVELVTFVGARAGLPTIDLVSELSSTEFHHVPLIAPAAALVAHFAIGVCWAVFYAFFFWGRFNFRPAVQGLLFALLPAVLAILVVYPELSLMRIEAAVVTIGPGDFFAPLTAPIIASLFLTQLLFGLTVGLLYRDPVGYSVTTKPRTPSPRRRLEDGARRKENSTGFMFATGVECSYPTIENGRWRCDEMDSTRHYELWQRDFELAREIGITHIRYGPPLHLIFEGPGRYDWNYIDPQMEELRERGPEPIIDLCHFGVPSWLGNFQNPEIGPALEEYAGAFAERYPWVRFYTPVNEMYVSARMSALDGLWNEQLRDEGAYARAAWNLADASVRMSEAILKRREDAILINSESSEFYQPCCPDPKIQEIADAANERRFLPLDLIFAHPLSERMNDLLCSQGISKDDLGKIGRRKVPRRSILGVDYYEWNERLIDRKGEARALGELFGWYVIADQYWQRYRRPMMHTETNKMDAQGAPRWLWRQWHNVQLLSKAGVPLVGFTWYSLTDQIDWSIAMAKPIGLVYPVGLFDLNREARIVGLAYKQLIDLYRDQPDYLECKPLKEIMG